MNTPEFEQAVSQLLDNEISAEQFEDLQVFLKSSGEARKRFRKLTELHSMLGLELAPASFEADQTRRRRAVERAVVGRARQALTMAGLAAAAVILASLLVMRLFLLREAEPTLSFAASPGTRCELSHDAEQLDGKVSPGQVMLEGSRLLVHSGVVELDYASGVRSIVRGPADLHLVEEGLLEMNEGSALFEVPREAVGFTVRTKVMEVTDLGTEFGVIAHPDGLSEEVHVFNGKVELRPLGGAVTETLTAGSARRIVEQTRLTRVSPNRLRFFDTLPDALPYLHWSFDKIVDGQFVVSGTHPHADEVISLPMQGDGRPPEARLVKGVRGKGLSFDGVGDFVQTNWPGIGGNSPRSVVMWIRFPEGVMGETDLGGIVWGTRRSRSGVGKFNFIVGPPLNTPIGRRNQVAAVTFGGWTRVGSTNLADGDWHCIAVTYSGEAESDGNPDVRLFVDGGVEFSETWNPRTDAPPINTEINGPGAMPLHIGRTAERTDKPNSQPFGYFRGEIDEVYVFEGVLDGPSIGRLFREKQL